MQTEWLAAEHHRIHVMGTVARWTQEGSGARCGPIHSREPARTIPKTSSFGCATCATRRQTVTVIPRAPRVQRLPAGVAA
jgi:hypothetical protein